MSKIEMDDRDGKATVVGVRVDGQLEPSDMVIVAMGPWSATAAQGLDLRPVFGQKYRVCHPNHSQLICVYQVLRVSVCVSPAQTQRMALLRCLRGEGKERQGGKARHDECDMRTQTD